MNPVILIFIPFFLLFGGAIIFDFVLYQSEQENKFYR